MDFALNTEGSPIYPDRFSDSDWLALKTSYAVGEFRAPCCGAPAIPKTSINGLRFFAHLSDECATSPESLWHLSAKGSLARVLDRCGFTPFLERPFGVAPDKQIADIYFEVGSRRVAIEVQHSYQTLNDYLSRQEKYFARGVENFWLVFKPRFSTLIKATARLRIKREFGGKIPRDGLMPCIAELPVAIYEPDQGDGSVRCTGGIVLSASEWIDSIVQGTFVYSDGSWLPRDHHTPARL